MRPIANGTEHSLLVTSYIKHKEFDLSFKSGWVLCSKIKRPIRFSYWMGKEDKMQDRCDGRLKFASPKLAQPYVRQGQTVILCPKCNCYHIVWEHSLAQEQQNSSLEEFVYDEQANANKLIELGWLCVPPQQVNELRKILNGGVNAVK